MSPTSVGDGNGQWSPTSSTSSGENNAEELLEQQKKWIGSNLHSSQGVFNMILTLSHGMYILHAFAPSWSLIQLPTQSITSCHIQFINNCHALLTVLKSNMACVYLLGRAVFSFFSGFCSAYIPL
jgi:hypothetical protein